MNESCNSSFEISSSAGEGSGIGLFVPVAKVGERNDVSECVGVEIFMGWSATVGVASTVGVGGWSSSSCQTRLV